MVSGANVLLATEEGEFAKKVSEALASTQQATLAGVCRGMSELRARLEHDPTPIAVIDIDSDPAAVLQDLDRIVPLYPATRFAVASSASSKELILEAMQAGARHFMHKKFIEAELDRVLERLLSEVAKAPAALGSVISVFSAGGGCGATTIVLNLANELRLRSGESVLTIDLDSCYGAVSSYLGIKGHYGITDILNRTSPIDKNLITSSAASYMDDFHVLMSPANSENIGPQTPSCAKLVEALEACRQAYKYTVIDAARVSDEAAKLLATVSRVILVVFQLTVKDIRRAKNMVSHLSKLGAKTEKVMLLANRFRRRGPMVPLEETKKVLGADSLHLIRNDFRKVVNCINSGQPLAQAAPRSGIRRDFCRLAESVHAYAQNGSSV